MVKPMKELVERVKVFDDSIFLADALREYAQEQSCEEGNDGFVYNLREAAESLEGMSALLYDIQRRWWADLQDVPADIKALREEIERVVDYSEPVNVNGS